MQDESPSDGTPVVSALDSSFICVAGNLSVYFNSFIF